MSKNIVNSRRRYLPQFRDLFEALFKIPDKEVQHRVLNAINGVINDHCTENCNHKIDATTQTEDILIKPNMITKTENIENGVSSSSVDLNSREVRKRRISKRIPRVEKSDEPIETKIRLKNPIKIEYEIQQQPENFLGLSPSFTRFDTGMKLLDDLPPFGDPSLPRSLNDEITKEDLKKQMQLEWESSFNFINGFFPIHKAIMCNELNRLKRQAFVYKYRKINIFDLYTEDNESLLQLAVKADSYYSIIDLLICYGANVNEIDAVGNTIIHLAIKYTNNIKILKKLLECIDFSLITSTNDDGQTILHFAVIEENFKFCKAILDYIDSKLNIKSITTDDESVLINFYRNELSDFVTRQCVKVNKEKFKIINQIDMKHGRTALFFALERKSIPIIFMLLSNWADPSIRDHSGMDCQTYIKERSDDSDIGSILSALINSSFYLDRCLRN